MKTIEICIHSQDNVTFLHWVSVPIEGFRLIMNKIMGASAEQIAQYEEELTKASLNSFSSADGEFTMITTNMR